jgi:hypothetical protein
MESIQVALEPKDMIRMPLDMGATGFDFDILEVFGAPMTPVSDLLIAHDPE